ncbi:hypothetical protein N781_07670 [Pontibacillus halophilus JSM 076056 = DSM 19796]|uniref:Uncharacterized protein n=1 Tax=Pontibacillus halophilus JSM 076056 = DSM 19796 TaxID=1385510 RepID=A0A0A5I192_9BACI|nr:TIGR01457 family HAD-type hydrolase [Pontibacillus halophilus]KGX89632.1 hypothetical protein N781_07670 [Pontibacillus halophilus JSM 076056 = DSM 19796]
MKTYSGYLIDLDGTMYRGEERIEEASTFVQQLKDREIPYMFVTNNSSKRPSQVVEKLRSHDIPATEEQVYTSSMATAAYIKRQKPDATVYAIGEEGLQSALSKVGLTFGEEQCDYVVIGMDREITYEKLAKAALLVRKGATFLSTNGDIAIPTERGMLPGNGSLTSVITVTTGVSPTFIGKPESTIMELALDELGMRKEETLMVGDNYETDIKAGMNAGLDTLLVHTGVTSREDLIVKEIQPTFTVKNLSEWVIE